MICLIKCSLHSPCTQDALKNPVSDADFLLEVWGHSNEWPALSITGLGQTINPTSLAREWASD